MTKNFKREEFACKGVGCCGKSAPISEELVNNLQTLRDRVGKSLTVNSGFRCKTHNARVGGEDNSMHTIGIAVDIAVPAGMTPDELAKIAETIPAFRDGGIGIYKSWVHLDVRKGKARWRKE